MCVCIYICVYLSLSLSLSLSPSLSLSHIFFISVKSASSRFSSTNPTPSTPAACANVPPPNQTASSSHPDTVLLRISGMRCGGCVSHCENALRAIPGVSAASVSLLSNSALVSVRRGNDNQEEKMLHALVTSLKNAGFQAEVYIIFLYFE